MKLNNKCICCESTNNLKTSMVVTIDDKQYDVVLCDEHAEDTTLKTVKELVKKKINDYENLLKQMKEFGIDIAEPSKGNNIVVASDGFGKDDSRLEVEESKLIPILDVSNKNLIKQRSIPQTKWSVSGVASGDSGAVKIESRETIDAQKTILEVINKGKISGRIGKDSNIKLPTIIDVESQGVQSSNGQQMVISKVVKDNQGGVTKIAVIDTGGDKKLQDRFKNACQNSIHKSPFDYKGRGYALRGCNACDGTGFSKLNSEICPKCKGTGSVSVY